MRKKYLNALLCGVIIATSTVTVSSCKDYDDDIAGLQEQVDAIKNKDAVTTTELNSAIQAVKDEYNKQIADLNGKLENVVSKEEFQALQSKLDELNEELNKKLESAATQEEVDALKKQIEDLEKQMENVATEDQVKGLQDQIDALEKKLENLEGLQGRLEALEEANRLFKEGGDLSAYNGLKQFINDQITAALAEDGAIAEYINNTVKNSILAEIRGNYDGTLEDLDTALKALDEKYDKLLGENGTIIKDIEELQLYKDAIEAALGKEGQEGADALQALLEEVNNNMAALSALLTGTIPAELETSIKAIISTELDSIETRIGKVETQLKQLGVEIEAIKDMVKSIVYIPLNENRKVTFSNIQFKKTSMGGWFTKYQDNQKEVKFRISPAAAVEELAKNYEIRLYDDAEVQTRAISNNYEIVAAEDGSMFTVVEEGIVSIKLKSLTDGKSNTGRALALALEPKTKEGLENDYDNITSDYFIAQTQTVQIADVKYVYSPEVNSTIYWNGTTAEQKTATYDEGVWMIYYGGTSSAMGLAPMTAQPLINAEDFTLTYNVSINPDVFTVNNEGVVSLKAYDNVSFVGKNTKIQSNVKLAGWYLASQNSKVDLGTVTVEALAEVFEAAPKTVEYNGTSTLTTIDINVKELLTGHFEDAVINTILAATPDINNAQVPVYDNVVKQNVNVAHSGNVATITLPEKTQSGEYDFVISYAPASTQTKVDIKIHVTVKDATLPYDLNDHKIAERWDGETVTLNPTSSGTSINYTSGYTFETMFDFGSYTNFDGYVADIQAKGGEVTVSSMKHVVTANGQILTSYNGIKYNTTRKTFEIDPATYRNDVTSSLTITSTYGGDTREVKIIVKVKNVNGTWAVAQTQNTSFEFAYVKNQAKQIINGITWTDALDRAMWENGAWKGNYTNQANRKGFNVKYQVKGDINMIKRYISNTIDPEGYITLTNGNKITFNNVEAPVFAPFEFQVVVKPTAPFGDIEGYDEAKNTITIKVKP